MRKIRFISLILVTVISACNQSQNGDFQTTENGLDYTFHQKNPDNQKPKQGDVVMLNMMYETADGKELFSTSGMDRVYLQTIKSPAHPGGSFEEALAMMHVGDSTTFRINAHDFLKFSMKKENLPENINNEDYILVHIKLREVLQKDAYGKQITKSLHVSEDKEMELLDNYLELTNTTVEPDSSGLYVVHLKEGTGKKPEPGDIVTVHYTGKLINGEPFDSSLGKKPKRFVLGESKVIEGWDIGLQQVKEGGKARFIIPSKLAYGKQGKDDILPYSTLIYEIELLNVN